MESVWHRPSVEAHKRAMKCGLCGMTRRQRLALAAQCYFVIAIEVELGAQSAERKTLISTGIYGTFWLELRADIRVSFLL
jgi:hypothetical protein